MTTNPIQFSKNKVYLINFIQVVLKKENKNTVILANKFYELLKVLVSKTPSNYKPDKPDKPDKNSLQIKLPAWTDVNTNYNFYISAAKQEIVEDWILTKFNILFDLYMGEFYNKIKFQIAIDNFIEMYCLPVDTFEMLKQKDYRSRTKLLSNKTKKISSVFNRVLSYVVFISPLLSLIVF